MSEKHGKAFRRLAESLTIGKSKQETRHIYRKMKRARKADRTIQLAQLAEKEGRK